MPYENIPGVGAEFLDGSFKTVTQSTDPRIMILGPASTGLSHVIFNATQDLDGAEDAFGSDAQFMKAMYEAATQGAKNIAVMRIGGRRGALVLTDNNDKTLTLKPELRDDKILDRYKLIMEKNAAGEQRILVYDATDEQFVYDSDDELVLDPGLIEVIDGGLGGGVAIYTVGDKDNPDTDFASADADDVVVPGGFGTPTFSEVAALVDLGDAGEDVEEIITNEGGAPIKSSVGHDGTDGLAMTNMEKYAVLEEAYQFLDYRDADLLIPYDVEADALNVATGAGLTLGANGLDDIVVGGDDDALGYLWKMLYRGKIYPFFFDTKTPFTDRVTFANNGNPYIVEQVVTSFDKPVTFQLKHDAAADVQVAEGATSVAVTVTLLNGAVTVTNLRDAIHDDPEAPKWLKIHKNGNDGDDTVIVGPTRITPYFVNPVELTGIVALESVPAAVWTRLNAGEDAEVREVNFAHQLASICYRASTTWSTMLGVISVGPPPAYNRPAIAEWVGQEPTYTVRGKDLVVDAAADNGEGVLGNKFHGGEALYRYGKIALPDGGDGLAFGGYILTKGASLPTSEPYGVEDDDEALDSRKASIDIGKHLLVTASWPQISSSWNGGQRYRGSLCGSLAGKIVVTPANNEPIGVNGKLKGVSQPPRMLAPLTNSLAKLRFVGTRIEEGLGHILVSVKTAAHPDSDYSRLSTIRSVNREVSGIRAIAKQYIGKEFSSTRLASLQTSIDGFLKAERNAGFNQGAVVQMAFTRQEKVMGRLRIKLKMIPPFSIEAITIETSLAADEEQLAEL